VHTRIADAVVDGDVHVSVAIDADIVIARQRGRALATQVGFSPGNAALIATAISELARNILLYAGAGEIRLSMVNGGERRGVQVVACDQGPGIEDVVQALLDGYSTSNRLGLGLPGVRRLMDEFAIDTGPGKGTTVVVRKWER
jgi:serine/threonine-protein kinase RsbT